MDILDIDFMCSVFHIACVCVFVHACMHLCALASYPGSRIKGVGGKESLVYTVCACSRFSQNSGKIVFVRILPC